MEGEKGRRDRYNGVLDQIEKDSTSTSRTHKSDSPSWPMVGNESNPNQYHHEELSNLHFMMVILVCL